MSLMFDAESELPKALRMHIGPMKIKRDYCVTETMHTVSCVKRA